MKWAKDIGLFFIEYIGDSKSYAVNNWTDGKYLHAIFGTLLNVVILFFVIGIALEFVLLAGMIAGSIALLTIVVGAYLVYQFFIAEGKIEVDDSPVIGPQPDRELERIEEQRKLDREIHERQLELLELQKKALEIQIERPPPEIKIEMPAPPTMPPPPSPVNGEDFEFPDPPQDNYHESTE